MVAEVYGPGLEHRVALASSVRQIFESTPGIVDVDWWIEEQGPKLELEVDREKVARLGIDRGNRVESREEREHQRDEVGVGDEPPLVAHSPVSKLIASFSQS